jgi:transcriptional regulator with XRE-family HTH domain
MTQNTTLPTAKTVADVIKATREAQGMTTREFGDVFNVSHNTVSQWERSIAEPDINRLAEWFHDERQWVHELAVEIFVARYRATLVTRPVVA